MIVEISKPFKHGSPMDRGSADRYYHRPCQPHWWPDGTGHGVMIPEEFMTSQQIAEYKHGWNNEEERKDWG